MCRPSPANHDSRSLRHHHRQPTDHPGRSYAPPPAVASHWLLPPPQPEHLLPADWPARWALAQWSAWNIAAGKTRVGSYTTINRLSLTFDIVLCKD